jgi:hypothetical protein
LPLITPAPTTPKAELFKKILRFIPFALLIISPYCWIVFLILKAAETTFIIDSIRIFSHKVIPRVFLSFFTKIPGTTLKKAGNSWYNDFSTGQRRYVISGSQQTPGGGSRGVVADFQAR